jgi:Plasmid pRiA4b ORF-3-like protein
VEDMIRDIVTLTVTLDDVEPRVWRRLEVPADYTFDTLHQALNAAMGWLDLHLHEFEIAGKRYGTDVDMCVEADSTLPEKDLVLGDVVRAGERLIAYWYDFGDDWWHTLKVEAVGPALAGVLYPRCTDGTGACPPEDCGGPPGFDEFKRALADPDHPEHEELLEWYGGEFDPGAFSVEATSALLRQVATGEPAEGWER